MGKNPDAISIAILVLLTFISVTLGGYLIMFLYGYFKKRLLKDVNTEKTAWLDQERKPLIPGTISTQTIQPNLNVTGDIGGLDDDDDSVVDQVDLKERDYSRLGRIIFVMRYHKKREELMIRLVQIEGLPASHELYSPNSAYVDVQLKYIGNPATPFAAVQKPPRLDICLQEVYYFIISVQQMMSHSVEFQINTFDEEYRRFVSGLVEVNLYEEMGEDILSGSEVVFVKDILEPFKLIIEEEENVKDLATHAEAEIKEELPQSRASSPASNMSWEPESRDLLTLSTNSLHIHGDQEITLHPLSEMKRYHSVGYLPTYEWTITDIPLDDEPDSGLETSRPHRDPPVKPLDISLSPQKELDLAAQETYYHIVPMTPLYPKDDGEINDRRQVMMKKNTKNKRHGGSARHRKRSTPKAEPSLFQKQKVSERSSSWPSVHSPEMDSSTDLSPEHHTQNFF